MNDAIEKSIMKIIRTSFEYRIRLFLINRGFFGLIALAVSFLFVEDKKIANTILDELELKEE